MLMLLFILVVISSIVYYFHYKNILRHKFHLRHYPSPPSRPIVGHLLDFVNRKKDILHVLFDYVINCNESVVINVAQTRIMLLTSEPKLLQFILTNSKSIEKSKDYKNLSRWLGTGLLTGGGEKWHKNRRILTGAFHFKILENFVPIFESNSKILVKKLQETPDKSSVNIYPYVTMCALDVICETAMGTPVNAQENVDSLYVKSVKTMCAVIIERGFSAYKMFDPIYFLTSDYQKELKALKVLHDYTNGVIEQKKRDEIMKPSSVNSPKKGKLAFLDLLMTKMREEHEITEDEIREEVNTIMFAGHDTTASAISFTLYCLATHQEVQERVVDELRMIMGDDFQRDVTLNDLKEMKYLDLVIKESLRLYPSVPFIGRELNQDLNYGDTILPKGLGMIIFLYGVHRNPKYFPDPDKFDPGRYESFRSPNNASEIFTYLPFSAGPRNCIGQKFALNEMKTVLSRVLRTFELVPAIPAHQLELSAQTVLISKSGVRIGLKMRNIKL